MHMCQVYLFMFVEHHRSFAAVAVARATLMNSIKNETSLEILLPKGCTLSQKMIHPATTETVIKPAIFRMDF